MHFTNGRWDAGVLVITATLDGSDAALFPSTSPPTLPTTVELLIDVARLRPHFVQAARNKTGKSVLASGAIRFRRAAR